MLDGSRLPPEALIKMDDVLRFTGLSKSELYARMADGSFPGSVELGPRAVAWIWGEVAAWNLNRPRSQPRLAIKPHAA